MNKLLTASLPALALLALGGCTATRSVATTEDDGVYYSSKDRTTAIVQAAPAAQQNETAPAENGEATNPDYQSSTTASSQRNAPNAPEYYDDNYSSSTYDSSPFRRPYAGPTVGLAYYSPPVVFAPAVSYGWAGGNCGFSPYGSAFCDPFYSPYYISPLYSPYAYYSPFDYGYGGSYLSVSIGYGYGYGRPYYGGYGYGYGRPYYGAYGYDPYYSRGYYGGGYGRSYGGGYGNYGGSYGGRQVIRANGNNAGVSNPVLVGPRRGRGGDVLAGRGTGNMPTGSGAVPPATTGGGRRNMDGVVAAPNAPTGGLTAPSTPAPGAVGNNGRRRMDGSATAPNSPTAISDHDVRTGSNGRLGRTDMDNTNPTNDAARPTRGRWRNQDEGGVTGNVTPGAGRGYEQPSSGQPNAQPQPIERTTRRPRLFESAPDNGQASTGSTRGYEQPAAQPQPQRTYEQPQRTYERPQRTYEQPQRTYEQPAAQPQRTYERPSYSAPSNSQSSSGSGGGNGGGGGGGRRGGRW